MNGDGYDSDWIVALGVSDERLDELIESVLEALLMRDEEFDVLAGELVESCKNKSEAFVAGFITSLYLSVINAVTDPEKFASSCKTIFEDVSSYLKSFGGDV